MKEFDVIIVGSGPAGSSAAVTALKQGLSVAIIDKATFPRNKLCGGLFTGRSEKAMNAIFGLDVTPELFLTSDRMRFSAKGKVLADITDAPPVHLTMRRDFDAMLHEQAVQKGAVTFTGKGVADIDEAQKTISIKSGESFKFKTLIGTDGVSSFVARHLFGRPFDPETIGFGLEIETPVQPSRDNAVEVDFDAATWGYGWSFPKKTSMTVGVGGINSRNPDMKANMAAYVDQVDGDETLKYKGHLLPFGDYRKAPGRGAIVLAGDAAGLVDPITGEGIALAMESGAEAAHACAEAIKAGAPDTAFACYTPRVLPIQKDLDQACRWRLLMFHQATEGYFKKAFGRGSHLQMKYLHLLAGDANYNDLRWALLKRMPKLAFRMVKHKLGIRQPE
ncbi:MAG: geranylgeranyl reductase family protein [Pseudomonadota bacterium]